MCIPKQTMFLCLKHNTILSLCLTLIIMIASFNGLSESYFDVNYSDINFLCHLQCVFLYIAFSFPLVTCIAQNNELEQLLCLKLVHLFTSYHLFYCFYSLKFKMSNIAFVGCRLALSFSLCLSLCMCSVLPLNRSEMMSGLRKVMSLPGFLSMKMSTWMM